jgi:hypothetical protein
MGLFRNEGPNLGPATTVFELSGYGSGNPVQNNYKPTTREIIEVPFNAIINAGSNLTGYIYQAPWSCQVIGIHYNCTTAAGAGVLSLERIIGDSVAPAAANGTTIILLTASTMTLSGLAANTRQNLALSTAAGSPLVLNAGDQIAYFLSTVPTSLVGGNVQIELAQLG